MKNVTRSSAKSRELFYIIYILTKKMCDQKFFLTQKIVITVRINNKNGKTVFKSICFRLRVGLAVGLLVAGVLVVACDIIISLG
ncbi:hypothetical protein BpHYR1_037374 [Brachionus plicatilis]|uniref:Uncharacterized protein n=1 Tax=Brachionus plicatilis TaxID=10195 RepID=A0A3M7S4U3_BRAPC|nr:hypothetical protein BpHYR1_037374 [Brachionus plicatilis]